MTTLRERLEWLDREFDEFFDMAKDFYYGLFYGIFSLIVGALLLPAYLCRAIYRKIQKSGWKS